MLHQFEGRRYEEDALLTPGEVASLFGVDPTTVANWAKAGKLTALKTLGGHRRFRAAEVHALYVGGVPEQRNGGRDA